MPKRLMGAHMAATGVILTCCTAERKHWNLQWFTNVCGLHTVLFPQVEVGSESWEHQLEEFGVVHRNGWDDAPLPSHLVIRTTFVCGSGSGDGGGGVWCVCVCVCVCVFAGWGVGISIRVCIRRASASVHVCAWCMYCVHIAHTYAQQVAHQDQSPPTLKASL
jgi:hypothetical protein